MMSSIYFYHDTNSGLRYSIKGGIKAESVSFCYKGSDAKSFRKSITRETQGKQRKREKIMMLIEATLFT